VSEAGFFRDEAGTLSPLGRFVLIVAVFLLVWPPICGSVGWWMKFHFGEPILGWIVTIVVYSYVICGLPALFAGVVHAVAAIRFRQNSILAPIAATGVATILNVALIIGIQEKPAHYLVNVPMASYFLFLIASLVASLICWRLTRRWARAA
jgi:hypothetical protein